MARIEIHGMPVGYSASKTAVERDMWIGHRVSYLRVAPRYEPIHGREQVVWGVHTMCGHDLDVVLEADHGFADARYCKNCARPTGPGILLVEVMPPMRRTAVGKVNRRERAVNVWDAF